MGDVDGGDAEILLHLFQLVSELHAQLCVEVGQRLVHADNRGARDEGARDGHALLLAAGELGDCLLELLVGKVDLLRDLAHLAVDLVLLQLLDLQSEGDVVVHRHSREEGVALEDDADVAVLDGDMGDVAVLDHNRAGDGLDEAGDGAQRGRLAAAGGAEEGEELALLDVDVDIVQRGEVPELDDDVVELDHRAWLLFFVVKNAGSASASALSLSAGVRAAPACRVPRIWKMASRKNRLAIYGFADDYSPCFWVRTDQSRLSQSGSAGASFASFQ